MDLLYIGFGLVALAAGIVSILRDWDKEFDLLHIISVVLVAISEIAMIYVYSVMMKG